MIFELYDLTLSPVTASLILGLALGAVFGIAAWISRFCLRRGVVGEGAEGRAARGVWVMALLVALLGTQGLVAAGWLDLSGFRMAASELPWLAVLLGGLLFGVGMVLARGCISRLTVLGGAGNLRALTVVTVVAIVAHATMKGVLAPLRVALGGVTFDLGQASTAAGLPGGAGLWAAVIALGAAALVWRSGARPRDLALAAVIGALIPLGWWGTGVALYDDFDPIALQSMAFTGPWTDALFYAVAGTSVAPGFGAGLIGGTLIGGFVAAAAAGGLQLESFTAPRETLRYVAGGALMGFGGVLAGGCTIGAGLSGVSTLSVAAALALAAIILGGLAARAALAGSREGRDTAVLTPAE